MNLKTTASNFISSAKTYWKTPPKGRYVTYKEIASLSGGGIGVRFVCHCLAQMTISVGNELLGNTIGITPTALYAIYIISLITSFPLTAIRARMIDNTRSMKGKYRPYLIVMGIPTVILGIGFIWMPYEHMSLMLKCITVLLFNIGFQFFYNFYYDSYDGLINVISPNSIERSDVLSVRCIVENLSPSLVNIAFPLLAKLVTGQNTLYDLSVYRMIYPPMLIFGFLISIFIYANVEEKIVQAKTHLIRVKFIDAFKAIAKNKYFWIISLAGWMGFLESAFASIMHWMYNYQGACDAGQYALITAIAGNASLWPNIIAPFFIRRYGKKRILIFTNLMSIGFIAMMLPVVRLTGSPYAIWLLLACTFVNTLITALGHLLTPSVNADIRDYQQYITGERIDGMFAAVGLIGNLITMATSSVLPIIYERAGLNEKVAVSLGYSANNVYEVLYNTDYFVKICTVLIIASIIGAALNVIPYFFFDFTETKQKSTISVLKIRALFEDYANGVLSDKNLIEALEIINEAQMYCDKPLNDLSGAKAALKKAKRAGKEEYAAVKAALREQREENEKIEIARFVTDELNKYTTEQGMDELESAREIAAAGPDGFLDIEILTKRQARAMPRTTELERNRRARAISLVSDMKSAARAIRKNFPDGIVAFDTSRFDELFKAEDDAQARFLSTAKMLKAAKDSKDAYAIREHNESLKLIKKEKREIEKQIKATTKENSIYHTAAKPYLDAVKIIKQAESYSHLDEIKAMYDDIKVSD